MASPVRKAILKAIGASEKKTIKKVGKRRKRPGTRGQPAIIKIEWVEDKTLKGGGAYMGDGRYFKKLEKNGQMFMVRDDGAIFKLRRDGRWQHTIQRKKKKSGLF